MPPSASSIAKEQSFEKGKDAARVFKLRVSQSLSLWWARCPTPSVGLLLRQGEGDGSTVGGLAFDLQRAAIQLDQAGRGMRLYLADLITCRYQQRAVFFSSR